MPIRHAAYLATEDRLVEGTALDLSLGGVFLETEERLELGARGALARIDTGIEVPVRVVRVTEHGIGLAFEPAEK